MSKSNVFLPALLLAAAASLTACSSDSATAPAPTQAPISSASAAPTNAGDGSSADPSSVPASSIANTGGGAGSSGGTGNSGGASGSGGTGASDASCTATELSVTLGATQGAAGSAILPVTFTNTSNRTCTIDGYPGISYVASQGGPQVGQAAVRTGAEVSPVELTPRHQAVALVKATQAQNFSSDACQPTTVSGLNVYSPNTTEAVFVPYVSTGCATNDPSITQLSVQPVKAE